MTRVARGSDQQNPAAPPPRPPDYESVRAASAAMRTGVVDALRRTYSQVLMTKMATKGLVKPSPPGPCGAAQLNVSHIGHIMRQCLNVAAR